MIPNLICSRCSSALAWNDRFCPSCGEPIEFPRADSVSESSLPMITCQQCGENNSAGAEYCSSCGAPLSGGRARKEKSESKKDVVQRVPPAKLVMGLATFLIGGLVVLELVTGKKELPQPVVHEHEEPAANMQALPQIEELEKKLAANPNDASLMLQLANTLHDNRFYEKAITYYTKYLGLNPKDADARVDLGICYNDSGNKDEAIRQMKEAIRFNPKHVLAHFNLGIIHLQAREVEEATAWFKKTIELAPGSEAAERARRLIAQHSAPPQTTTN